MPRHGRERSIRVGEDTVIPLEEIQFRASRSSGPGGQHANVTASRIEAVFDVRGLAALSEEQRELLRRKLGDRVTAVAQDARSQARNRELALERLREKIAGGPAAPQAAPSDQAVASRAGAAPGAEAANLGAQAQRGADRRLAPRGDSGHLDR